jgi:hypothetical protein
VHKRNTVWSPRGSPEEAIRGPGRLWLKRQPSHARAPAPSHHGIVGVTRPPASHGVVVRWFNGYEAGAVWLDRALRLTVPSQR